MARQAAAAGAARLARKFPGKTYFFLSARVHPGESPAQWMWEGFMDLLLSKDDPRAKALRRHFGGSSRNLKPETLNPKTSRQGSWPPF